MDVDQVEDDVLLRTPSEQSEEVTDDARSERSSITVNTLTERLKMMGESFSNTSASDKVTEPTQQGAAPLPVSLEDMDPHVLLAYAKRKLQQEKGSDHTFCGHRATTAPNPAHADNSALGIFFVCPGSGVQQSSGHPVDYKCFVRDMCFSDVVPDEQDPQIRSLTFSSIFALARMISIYENEVDKDKKRYLMRSTSYNFITISGAQKAYTFFKRNCEHVMRSLILHDGSSIALTSKNNVDIDIAQLNDLTNAGLRYALTHSWDDVAVKGPKKNTLLLVPDGFRGFARIVTPADNVSISCYRDLNEATSIIRKCNDIGVCVFLTPTSEQPYSATEWQSFTMVMTTAARLGGKLLAVSSPRGEEAWEQNRKDTHDAFEVIREAAAAMRHNVVTMFGSVPSINEPFACLGQKTRFSPHGAYPAGIAKAYWVALQAYLAPHLRCDLYQVLDAPIDRKVAYRNKKRPAIQRSEALHGESSSAQQWDEGYQGWTDRGRGSRRGGRGHQRFMPYHRY